MIYEQVLIWSDEIIAKKICDMATARDCVELLVDGKIMYFYDKFTFDHICYHYLCKMSLDKRPVKKLVSEIENDSNEKYQCK